MKPEVLRALENMKKRGYKVHTFESAAEMREFVLQAIPEKESVGFGGSVTVGRLHIFEALRERGNTVFHHWSLPGEPRKTPEESREQQLLAHGADNYIMSANAIAENGMMLNIDGFGNRVAALINGPKKVYILVGENKFTSDEDEAVKRCKTKACPENASRLKLGTPCADSGVCSDCSSPERICNNAVWTWNVPAGREYHICAAAETLGL